jgi:hypothetical protein
MLLEPFHTLLEEGWKSVFPQDRTRHRAVAQALATPCVLGRRTLSRTLCALGRTEKDWSADYKLFSRSPWKAEGLFAPVLEGYLSRYPQGPVAVAFDDTKLKKTGKKIPTASWQRDPLSPPFHVNLLYGLRFIQASLLFPHHQEGDYSARGYPVRFSEAPVVKKPGKRATDKERQAYRVLKKEKNLSRQTRELIGGLRAELDATGAASRPMVAALDGSFCNRILFKTPLAGVELLARARKDARLCFPAAAGSRRKYDTNIFTPEEVRQDPSRPWKRTRLFLGGKWRTVKYKVVTTVLWKRGGGQRRLRLIVIAPLPYKLSLHARLNYRQPAYLLTTDHHLSTKRLLQIYCDRWQIEVNHRDEKSLLGVGQAQVWSAQAVPRQPAFVVAGYSLLLLAGLQAQGPGRTDAFLPLPQWRKSSPRPSLLDLLSRLRQEINETPVSVLGCPEFTKNMTLYAHT